MTPYTHLPCEGATAVVYAKDHPIYDPLPALVFTDGRVMTEWVLSEAEREAVARGENLRVWVWTFGQPLQPLAVQITDEQHDVVG